MSENKKSDPVMEAEEESIEQLRNALCAIAYEVQRYTRQDSQPNLNYADIEESIAGEEEELESCKIKLKAKRKIIHGLRENLKTACSIAKTALTAQENGTSSHNDTIAKARHESACLVLKNTEFNEELRKLASENQVLADQLKNLRSFVGLGFQELQKMRKEDPEELPVLMQLKKIMICCGQYYADFSNEHEKCLCLEQKNRYLNNKIMVLENNLQVATEELKKQQNVKSQKFKKSLKGKSNEYNASNNVGYACSDHRFAQTNIVARTSTTTMSLPDKREDNKCTRLQNTQNNLDLSSHLSLVKNLLNDQDSMLQDLKKLSSELGSLNV